MASNCYAAITCSNPKLSKIIDHDPIYHFKAEVKCNLVGEAINLKALKDAYRDDITKHGSQFKVHSQHDYDDKGHDWLFFDVTQAYDSINGALKVRADILLLDDNSKTFFMELRSKSIVN